MKALRPYPEYKPSGVEWLGEIPEHWEVVRLKWLVSKIGSGKTPRGGAQIYADSGVLFLRSQNVHFDGLRLDDAVYIDNTIDADMVTTRVRSGDVLLNITGASLGRCCAVPDGFPPANVSQHVCIIRPQHHRVETRFLSSNLASRPVQAQVFADEVGTSREGLAFDQVSNLLVALPTDLNEQCAIARFLGRETARIDGLVAKKERLIALLQEKRTALISHAVTKGLNPAAPMKDSGVEWLGKIPVHWGMRRLKFLLSGIDQGWSPQCDNQPAQEGQWGVLKTGCVNGGIFDAMENKSLPDGIEPPLDLEVRCGDVLMSRASGSSELVGSVALVGQRPAARLLLSDKTYRLGLHASLVEADFFIWVMGSPMMRHQISGIISGAEGLANNIGQNDIRNVVAPLPPLAEQHAILGYVRDETLKLDALSAKIRTGIERLEEYRTALISAAVTGKIDVRQVSSRPGQTKGGSTLSSAE